MIFYLEKYQNMMYNFIKFSVSINDCLYDSSEETWQI